MRKINILTVLAAIAVSMSITSCKEKKESEVIITKMPVAEVKSNTPTQLQDFDYKEDIEWLEKTYSLTIARRTDQSLPVVTDENGNKNYDNRITMRVSRYDDTVFFSKDFTKNEFAQHCEQSYIDKSVMLGFVFEGVEGDNLVFTATIGSPDILSEDYMPFRITLSRLGNLSISKGKSNETADSDGYDEV